MQHPNKHACNIHLEKQMKHLEQTLATYVYSHCNKYNIPIYFCNINIKRLQHIIGTSETLETYSCNMRFQQNPGRQVGGRSIAQRDPDVRSRWRRMAAGGRLREQRQPSGPAQAWRGTAGPAHSLARATSPTAARSRARTRGSRGTQDQSEEREARVRRATGEGEERAA